MDQTLQIREYVKTLRTLVNDQLTRDEKKEISKNTKLERLQNDLDSFLKSNNKRGKRRSTAQRRKKKKECPRTTRVDMSEKDWDELSKEIDTILRLNSILLVHD